MNNIKNMAKDVIVKETGNIAELDSVSTALLVLERTGTNTDGEEYSYNVIVVDRKDYRIPLSVLQQLKSILEVKPNLEFFKVSRIGTGMQTKYQVIPL